MSKEYTEEFKIEAVKLAKEVGNKKAAEELGVPKGTIGTWRHKATQGEMDLGLGQQTPKSALTMAAELKTCREKIKALEKENFRIKRENEFLEEASRFFAASRKK